MDNMLLDMMKKKNAMVISDEKCSAMINFLKHNDTQHDAKLKWYVKKKNIQLMNIPELQLEDVLVIPKTGMLIH